MKVRCLADLGTLRRAMHLAAREAAEQAALAMAAKREAARRQHAQHDVFAKAVGPVHRLRDRGLAEINLPRPPPHPRQRELDEAAALAESMSDEVTLESLLLTDDGLSFRRPGIGQDVVGKLRRGHWALQGELDLHGCNRDEARDLLGGYVSECHRRGLRCLRVVHGKGTAHPAASRCSKPGCSAGWRSATR